MKAIVREGELLLHEALAEGTAADDGAAVVVLDGPREDLAGGGGVLADEDGQADVLELALAVGPEHLARPVQAFHVHDGIAPGQELVGQQQRLVQEAAGIVPQVHHQVLHALLQQFGIGLHEVLPRGGRELGEPHIAGGVVHHEGGVDAVQRNLAADDLEGDDVRAAAHGHDDLGPGRALHPPDHAVLRELHAGDDLVVHLQEPVAGQHARLLGRAAGDHLQHDGRVVRHVELDADALEIAGQLLVGLLPFHGRQVHRVRVQLRQGPGDGGVRHPGLVDGVDIVLLDLVEDEVQFPPLDVLGVQDAVLLPVPDDREREDHAEQHAQEDLREADPALLLIVHIGLSPLFPPRCRRGGAGRCRPSAGTRPGTPRA